MIGNITVVQIIGVLFALFAWSRAFLRYKEKSLSTSFFFLWSLIWASVIIVAISPSLIGGLGEVTGIGRSVDVLVYLSIILLFYLMFRLYIKLDSQNQKITQLVREVAID